MNSNRIREARAEANLTQSQLADRSGVPRTSIAAIEAGRLTPSVSTAIALAQALDTTVEDLFSTPDEKPASSPRWAIPPQHNNTPHWTAEVQGQHYFYPADSTPLLSHWPDLNASSATAPEETLVFATCDPAAGFLASLYQQTTGYRLLILPRSSGQALSLLEQRIVHVAGIHLAPASHPERNAELAAERLGVPIHTLQLAHWQEGVALAPSQKARTIKQVTTSRLTWIGREQGSGARQCLDQLLPSNRIPKRLADNHRNVALAIRSGWADAGVCHELVSSEAGLNFLPVQQEAYDLCFPTSLLPDKRLQALITTIRSKPYRTLMSQLPGYNTQHTGDLWQTKP